jgi:UDPglucose 6-dehydrogenase
MNIAVLGLWHLGSVTAACAAAAGHQVMAWDPDPAVVAALADGRPPVQEPGLDDLVRTGLSAGTLRFSPDLDAAVGDADIVWITFDTPVDAEDRADVKWVLDQVTRAFPHLKSGALVLSSSQLPVGSVAALERAWQAVARGRTTSFACAPENLRLGHAIDVFTKPDRVVVGTRTEADRARLSLLYAPITDRVEWMSVESAEMTKHAINAFLATSVTFINELATLCEQVGADAGEVERGLKTEARIGPKAYLSPGGAFAGGTLARDIVFLSQLGKSHDVPVHLLSSVKTSNDAHSQWARRRLSQRLGSVEGKTIAVWGLTYKPGTDTLRRSSAVELCQWLANHGATVRAHDPAVRSLPAEIAPFINLASDAAAATEGASALVVATAWPEYRQVPSGEVRARMVRPLVFDASQFLRETFGKDPAVEYLSVGRA